MYGTMRHRCVAAECVAGRAVRAFADGVTLVSADGRTGEIITGDGTVDGPDRVLLDGVRRGERHIGGRPRTGKVVARPR
jgi:hypothetical protein